MSEQFNVEQFTQSVVSSCKTYIDRRVKELGAVRLTVPDVDLKPFITSACDSIKSYVQRKIDEVKGAIPNHFWDGTTLHFENPDGTFDEGVDLKGEKGDKGKRGPPGPPGTSGTVSVNQYFPSGW